MELYYSNLPTKIQKKTKKQHTQKKTKQSLNAVTHVTARASPLVEPPSLLLAQIKHLTTYQVPQRVTVVLN